MAPSTQMKEGSKLLFVDEIARNSKNKFKLPLLDTFNRSKDTSDHMRNYQAKMELHGASEAQMRLAFPTTLKSMARVWFNRIKPASI